MDINAKLVYFMVNNRISIASHDISVPNSAACPQWPLFSNICMFGRSLIRCEHTLWRNVWNELASSKADLSQQLCLHYLE